MEQLHVTDIPLQPRPAECPIPLVPWQLRVWNAMMKRGTRLSDWTVYGASVRVLGPLNVSLLQKSIELVVQRHESLRTRIVSVNGFPRQCVDPAVEYDLKAIDVERLSQNSLEAAKCLAQEFADIDRDLSFGPLFEARLLRLSSREHVLLVALDHMFSDAASDGILSRDIWTLYKHSIQGRPLSLPPLPVQFADYSVWQQQTCAAWRMKHEAYWRKRLRSAPHIQFPVEDGPRKAESRSISTADFLLDKTLSTKLRDIARKERTLPSIAVLAIYVATMSRWCNQRDIVLTFVSNGRHRHPELKSMIGLLPCLLFFRIEMHREDRFLDLLKRLNFEFCTALQHQDYNRVPDLIPECPTDLCFNWAVNDSTGVTAGKQAMAESPVEIQPFPVQRSHQNLDAWSKFTLTAQETPAGLSLRVWYRDYFFERSTIESFIRYFHLLAEEVANNRALSLNR